MSDQEQGTGEKVVFIGESGVGKTCIIARFIKGIYVEGVSSTAASYASKTIDIPELGESITFDIWDTAGQEKYRSLTKFFFKGAKMAILVYDITHRESFDNLKSVWLKELKEHGEEHIVLGIAGNKSDLYDEEVVPEQEARDYAKSIGAVFSLTSAQNNSGINELFKNLAIKYLDPNYVFKEPGQQNQEEKPSEPSPSPSPSPSHKPKPKPKQKEEPQNIKIGRKDVAKKNEEQKKKKGPC